MPRKYIDPEDYYDDDDTDERPVRHFKKEKDRDIEKKKRWDRESMYDRNNDYNEQR